MHNSYSIIRSIRSAGHNWPTAGRVRCGVGDAATRRAVLLAGASRGVTERGARARARKGAVGWV